MDIKYQGNTLKHQKNEFTMTVGKHTATVICKNKRDGKQRASQAILQVRKCGYNLVLITSTYRYLSYEMYLRAVNIVTGPPSTYNFMGLTSSLVRKPICQKFQGKETRRTGNHSTPKQSCHKFAKFRHIR